MENIGKFKTALSDIGKALENEFDYDFSINEKFIGSVSEFEQLVKKPFEANKQKIFYRGERINDLSRPLVPTLLRNKKNLLEKGSVITNVNSEFLLDYYKSLGNYYEVFRAHFGEASPYRLYELCAFSQHYLDVSPFIDFTKSLYVALSFALKNRKEYKDDIVLYTAETENYDNYTKDIVTAECWLNSYKVTVLNSGEELLKLRANDLSRVAIKKAMETYEARAQQESPEALLIDIPTNDLMKYQQGVFLLLTDFSLYSKSYPTKNVRRDFAITKYVISRDICPQLLSMVNCEAPWYRYECLTDVKTAMKTISNSKSEFPDMLFR